MVKALQFFLAAVCVCVSFVSIGRAEQSVNKIVAVVNGEMITLHDVQTKIATDLARQQKNASAEEMRALVAPTLDRMINDILLLQEAERYKITADDTEVEAEVRKIMLRNRMSQKAFEAQLIRQGTNIDNVKKDIRDNTVRQRISSIMIGRKVVIRPDEVEKYYNSHRSELVTPKTVEFSVILFARPDMADQVRAAIATGAVSFEEAARRVSSDSSAKNGGRVEPTLWNYLPEQTQKMFESLPPEGLSPVVQNGPNKVLYKLHEINEGGRQLTLQEATPMIQEILKEPLIKNRYDEYTQQLRSKAVIDYRL